MPTDQEQLDTLLTVKDVAEILCMGVRTVWRKSSEGAIPKPVTLGRLIKRWRASDLQRYLDRLPVQ
jgi:predicted DNA-binding transcriptional regulator AlpA